uniref:ShKT domain-containing protein n=1 Tax=Trichuris muris TaxID=70415 RepID=A0A5S6QZN4_TRIMR
MDTDSKGADMNSAIIVLCQILIIYQYGFEICRADIEEIRQLYREKQKKIPPIIEDDLYYPRKEFCDGCCTDMVKSTSAFVLRRYRQCMSTCQKEANPKCDFKAQPEATAAKNTATTSKRRTRDPKTREQEEQCFICCMNYADRYNNAMLMYKTCSEKCEEAKGPCPNPEYMDPLM